MKEKPLHNFQQKAAEQSARILYDIVSHIPKSKLKPVVNPQIASEELISKAAIFSSTTSASLSAPGGLLGLATIFPDLATIWRIQSKLVADIAALHGQSHRLNQEAMIWCLFRHTTTEVAKDFAVRLGERILLQQLSQKALQQLLKRIGVQSFKKISSKSIARFIPFAGATVSGFYTWHSTQKVGQTAMELFSNYESEDTH